MSTQTKIISSDGTGPKLNGTQLFFRTRTEYTIDNNGKVTDSTIYVYYTPYANGLVPGTGASGWQPGSETGDGFQKGGYTFAAGSTDKGKTFISFAYNQGDADAGRIPPGKKVGDPVLSPQAMASLNDPNGVLNQAINNSVINTAVKKQKGLAGQLSKKLQHTAPPDPTPPGGTPPGGTPPGRTPSSGSTPLNKDQEKTTKAAFADVDARKDYSDLKYPENLQLAQQDCIQFSVLEYIPRGLSLELNATRRRLQGKKPIGTITLPIPGGISDTNSANWQKSDLDLLSQGIGNLVIGTVSEGRSGAEAAAGDLGRTLSAAGQKTLSTIIAARTAQEVMGANVLSRAYGGVLNPNSELLFEGPELRTFTFTFRMSPRSSSEAIKVKKIIRTFKQAMSVQRGKSNLILRAPNTFGIKYLTAGGKEHPYLTKFKECALTQCNINYTPDGTYMTYAGEPSMTAYELQLTFQELEPIFNDDYSAYEKDNNLEEDSVIGY